MTGKKPKKTERTAGPTAHHGAIAEQMRRLFESYAQEPVPDDIQRLAAQLEEKLRGAPTTGEATSEDRASDGAAPEEDASATRPDTPRVDTPRADGARRR